MGSGVVKVFRKLVVAQFRKNPNVRLKDPMRTTGKPKSSYLHIVHTKLHSYSEYPAQPQ
jgi:hypothetical protein